jgi:acetyl-CoA carboxylase biotin carboxyl carrier protein
MFKLSEIKELIKLVDQTSVQELEIDNEGSRLFIRKPGKTESVIVSPTMQTAVPQQMQAPQQPAAQAESKPAEAPANTSANNADKKEDANLHKITSPMVGTFYSSPTPDAAPYVKKGDKVTDKAVVCIVEAMKLMNEIEAEVKGEIVEVLVENGQLVEFGQPLFTVKPQ